MKKLCLSLSLSFLLFVPVLAQSSQEQVLKIVQEKLGSSAKLRADQLIENNGDLWMLLVPKKGTEVKDELELVFRSDDDFLFSNGWIYTPVIEKDGVNTIKSFDFYAPEIQAQLLESTIVPEIIVPKNFKLPRDLALVAGHLPLAYRDVELATVREQIFRKRLAEEKASSVSMLAYDYSKSILKHINVKSDGSNDEPISKSYDELSSNLSLLSGLKKFGKDYYLSDFNKGIVYKAEIEDAKEPKLELKEFLSIDSSLGLKDFAFSADGKVAYALTSRKPKLLIYRTKNKELIKQLDIGANPYGLVPFVRSSDEVDYMLLASKATGEISIISSYDHRAQQQIKLGENVLPGDFIAGLHQIFVIAKDKATNKKTSILVVDWVSSKVIKTIELEQEPSKLALSTDELYLYIAGRDKANGKAVVSRLNTDSYEIEARLELGPDIIDPSDLAYSSGGSFLIVGSSGSESLGIVDLDSFELVSKVNIGSKSHQLLVL